MSSIFNAPAYSPAAQPSPRATSEQDRLPPSQTIGPAGAASSAAPNGAGAPAPIGAVAEPTGLTPAPAPTPPVSVSQLGRVAAAAINGQEPGAESATGTPQTRDADPAAAASRAAQGYRDGSETTNGAEPGRLMMAA